MEPFESVYAGNFIFSLGLLAGSRKPPPSGHCVSLLAQNRGDQEIGDVVATWKGRNFVIEFKRNEAAVRSEMKKPHRKTLLKHLQDARNETDLKLADAGHFVAFGEPNPRDTVCDMAFMPYVHLEGTPRQPAPKCRLNVFLNNVLINGEPRFGLRSEGFRQYISVLSRYFKQASAGSGGGLAPTGVRRRSGRGDEDHPKIGALLVNYDETAGTFLFMNVDLARTLEMELGQSIDGKEPDRARRRSLGPEL